MQRMKPAPPWAVAVLVVAVLALLALVALAARTLPGRETRPPPFVLDIDAESLLRWMEAALIVLGALLLILLLLPGRPPIELPSRKKTSPLRLLVAVALLVAVLAALWPDGARREEPPPVGDGTTVTEEEAAVPPGPDWRWGPLVLATALALLLWGVAAASRSTVEPEAEDEEPAEPEILTEVEAILDDLDNLDDPRAVVIGAYARMERALTVDGLPRHPSEAPLEYLARALMHLRVSREAVRRLTGLFEVARFSHHRVAAADGAAAVAALTAIRSELGEPAR